MKPRKTMTSLVRPIENFGAVVCAVFVAVNIAIIFASVFMRYVFHRPILGTTELVSLLMPYIAYFAIGYTDAINGHIQMSALCSKYKGRHKYISQIIIYGIALAVFAILFYVSGKNFIASVAKMEKFTAVITLYAWVGKFAVVGGSAIMLIQLLARVVDAVIDTINYRPESKQDTASE